MKKDTLLATAGRSKKYTGTQVNPTIARASTVIFDSVDEMNSAVKNRNNQVDYYGRRGTSTTFAFCQAMAELDNAEGCLPYPSGTSAITAALLSFLSTGDHLLMVDTAYEPTRDFCQNTLARMGIETTFYNPMVGADIEQLVRPTTKVIFLESPGSLTMEVQDVPSIVAVAKANNITTIIDNTYATALNFKPLDFGIDISVQSATKYINGHSDIMLGIACANQSSWPTLRNNSYELGLCASVDDLYTALRGIRTLGVRMREHDRNALEIAHWLSEREEVDHIRHPAFESCPGQEYFMRDYQGGNGLFSFVLKAGNRRAVAAMLDGYSHFKMGFSWGGFESLVIASHSVDSIRTASKNDFSGPLIRLHVGLEDTADLIDDLAAGFDRFMRELARD